MNSHCLYKPVVGVTAIGMATKRLRILSLGSIDKIRNHLIAKPIDTWLFDSLLSAAGIQIQANLRNLLDHPCP